MVSLPNALLDVGENQNSAVVFSPRPRAENSFKSNFTIGRHLAKLVFLKKGSVYCRGQSTKNNYSVSYQSTAAAAASRFRLALWW